MSVSPVDVAPVGQPGPGTDTNPDASATVRHRWDFVRRFASQRLAVAAFVVLLLMVLVAALGELVTPQDPYLQDLSRVLEPPNAGAWLGTDELGRDVVSRLIISARTSLTAAAYAVTLAVLIGVPAGTLGGYAGGWADTAVMRATDAVMAFPPLILAIAIVGALGPSLRNAMIAVGIVFAPRFARLSRASALNVRRETFIDASRTIGTPSTKILRRHVLPNILPPILVQIALTLGYAMLAEAGLSFIGLGAQSPDSSWGSMLGRSYRHVNRAPSLLIFPGIAIALTVLACNFIGDGMRNSIGRRRSPR